MNKTVASWVLAVLLALGALFVVGIDTQRAMQLETALSTAVPDSLNGLGAHDIELSEGERAVSGVTDYLMRLYEAPEGTADSTWLSVYVGFYDRQIQGKTIHSPKNCLPGSGWEALQSEVVLIQTEDGPAKVNRYLLQNEKQLALVLYWYQGRGRVQANEYWVKWDLLRDAAIRQRSEEALVRIVVPIRDGDEEAAFSLASRAATVVIPSLWHALPN